MSRFRLLPRLVVDRRLATVLLALAATLLPVALVAAVPFAASAAEPIEGRDYFVISPAQPVATTGSGTKYCRCWRLHAWTPRN